MLSQQREGCVHASKVNYAWHEKKMPKRYELDWKDYRLHHNLPNLKIKPSNEQYDFTKSEDEEIKDD